MVVEEAHRFLPGKLWDCVGNVGDYVVSLVEINLLHL